MDAQIWGIDWKGLLVPGIGIAEKILRPVLVYFLLILGLRLAGKREMAQMSAFDMVVLIMLANAVQNSIIGNDNSLSGGIIGAAVLIGVNGFMAWLIFENRTIERIFLGRPDILIFNGKIRQDRLRKERITVEELTEAAHKQGIVKLSDVVKATLDPDGGILFVEKEPSEEVTRHRELLLRIEALSAQLDELRQAVAAKSARS